MRNILLASAAMLMLAAAPISAQTATGTGTASASSGSSSASQSGAIAHSGGGAGGSAILYIEGAPGETRSTTTANINQNTRLSGSSTVREQQSGTVRNEFAPAVSAPAMGSGHPCGLGNSLGISIIGGGVTGGATRVDDACLLGQMGYRTAATAMIAARNPSACAALVAAGDISPESNCGGGGRSGGGIYSRNGATGPAVAAPTGRPAAAVARPVGAGNLAPVLAVASRNPGGWTVCERTGDRRVRTDAVSQQAKLACAATLGLR